METAAATRIVPKDYIPRDSITREHAALKCARTENINEVLQDMETMKRDITQYGQINVHRIMLEVSQKRNVTSRYKKDGKCMLFLELRHRWRDWKPEEEPELRKDFFHIAVGHFDLYKGWADELEEKFMEEHGLAYEVEQYQEDSASHRKKRKAEPFVKRIIHKCRVDAVIELFYFGKSTHGWYINSTNKGGPQGFRRLAGKYDDAFIHNKKGRTKDGKWNCKLECKKKYHHKHLTTTFIPLIQYSKK